MKHILENTYQELKKSESQLYGVKNQRIFYVFSDNFKRKYSYFISIKKEFLLNYSSLYSDILIDSKSLNLIASEVENINTSITYITDTIERAIKHFNTIITRSQEQRRILEIEQFFLLRYIDSFKNDLQNWIQNHAQELQLEITKLQNNKNKTSNIDYKSILELQVKRLELQIQKVSNIIK